MVFLSPGLKGVVIEMINPTKHSNYEALKTTVFFVFFKTVKKDEAVQVTLLESANMC